MNPPLFSIVIANYNYGRFLADAIESVLAQGISDNVELIVCDAASTDNSVDIIKKYAGGLPPNTDRSEFAAHLSPSPITWWCSEKDGGQSAAFNKGFSHAKGRFLTWLNADDIMPKGALQSIYNELLLHPECEWFTGNMFRFTEDGTVIAAPWGPHSLPSFLQTKGMPIAVYGPATIFTKRIFDAAGGMKLHQNFMMDTDLWMRFVMMGVKQRRINCFCWAFRMHVDSKTAEFGDHKLSPEQRAKFEAERKASHKATGYKPSKVLGRLWQLWRLLDGSYIKGLILKRTFKTCVV